MALIGFRKRQQTTTSELLAPGIRETHMACDGVKLDRLAPNLGQWWCKNTIQVHSIQNNKRKQIG